MIERPKFYKKCPACGAVNADSEAICANCFVDISSVAAARGDAADETPPERGCGVTACPKCGASNPDYSQLCDNCGEDISAAPRRTEKGAKRVPRLFFLSREEKIAVELSGGTIFGRCDNCADQDERDKMNCGAKEGVKKFIDCSKFETVSRMHARIVFENECYYIVPLPESKNMTRLNGVKLHRGNKYKLSHGDSIDFSKRLKLKVFIK